MIEVPSVDRLMADGLSEWLDEQTELREETRKTVRSRTIISLVAAGIAGLGVLIFVGSPAFAFAAAVGLGAAGQFWAAAARDPVVRHIKQEMNTRIAAAIGCSFSHEAMPGPEFERARLYDLLPSYDVSAFEDRWDGDFGGSAFALFEGHLQEWQGSGKHRRLKTVFQGVIITIRFARDFHGVTLIERAGNRMTLFGLRDSITIDERKLERVRMVDPRFEDEFTVWSDDPVEARYLVHPNYVERLIEIEQRFAGQEIRALFQGGELLIILEARNMFESGSLDAENDRDRMATTIEQISSLGELTVALNERPRS